MGEIIKGKEIALSIKNEITQFVLDRKDNNLSIPKMASIVVGEDGGSIFYVNAQEKVATSLGIQFEKIFLNEDISEEELIAKIEELNGREDITGVMLQVPLPKKFDEKRVISTISPKKDIDCLTYENQGKLYSGDKSFIPCTPKSVITILESLNVSLEGKEAVVIGRSNIVGKPVASLLLEKNCTVTVCHSRTKDLKEVCRRADILVVAIGRPKFIDDSFVKDGAIVIDVGTSSVEGKITGDVDFDKVSDKTSFITPVPGGVGALTTTLLMKNVCEAMK